MGWVGLENEWTWGTWGGWREGGERQGWICGIGGACTWKRLALRVSLGMIHMTAAKMAEHV